MKPERQKEYDALGLPWKANKQSPLDIILETDGWEMEVFLNQTYSKEIADFAVKAANSHHTLVDQNERLSESVQKAINYFAIMSLGEYADKLRMELVEALKETAP